MKILLTGDINFRMLSPLDDKMANKVLAPFWKKWNEADFRVINLETPLGNPAEHTPIYKAGPNLISDPKNIAFIKALRADAASLANNHTGDYGYGPIHETLALLDAYGIKHCGAGKNIDEAYLPAVFEKDGRSVAVLSICENEFGVAGEHTPGTAGYEPRKTLRAIRKAKEICDTVVVFFHGGNEHNPLPSPATQERYRLLCDMGADAVIATHTHCPQGWEIYDGKPIVYSMGNFLFKSSSARPENDSWFYGYMVVLTIEETIGLEVIPYRFTQNLAYTSLAEEPQMLVYLEKLNEIIADSSLLQKYFSGWAWLHPWVAKFPENQSGVAQCAAGDWDVEHCEAHHAMLDELFRIFAFKEVETAKEWALKVQELQKMPV